MERFFVECEEVGFDDFERRLVRLGCGGEEVLYFTETGFERLLYPTIFAGMEGQNRDPASGI